jgi:hypothetical protein
MLVHEKRLKRHDRPPELLVREWGYLCEFLAVANVVGRETRGDNVEDVR